MVEEVLEFVRLMWLVKLFIDGFGVRLEIFNFNVFFLFVLVSEDVVIVMVFEGLIFWDVLIMSGLEFFLLCWVFLLSKVIFLREFL